MRVMAPDIGNPFFRDYGRDRNFAQDGARYGGGSAERVAKQLRQDQSQPAIGKCPVLEIVERQEEGAKIRHVSCDVDGEQICLSPLPRSL